MIVVRVELWSARTGDRTELGTMYIANDGERSRENTNRGDGKTIDRFVCTGDEGNDDGNARSD